MNGRSKKIIDKNIAPRLDQLTPESQALYYKLLMLSDDAGIISNNGNYNLLELHQSGLIVATAKHVIIKFYFNANYGKKLNPEYSPTKSVFKCIADAGYSYNAGQNEIEVPTSLQITNFDSFSNLRNLQSSTNVYNQNETTSQAAKIGQSPIISFIGSINFALYLSIALMFGQSVHTSFTLHSISHIPNPYNLVSAIGTAIIMDFLIIFYVINGRKNESMVFFIFCSLMNLFSYHINTNYFTYQSFFAIAVSIAIPYSVHSVSGMVKSKSL